ncbi:methyltransferase domain-containing protein [Saccharopolyspora sp. NPDC000995]
MQNTKHSSFSGVEILPGTTLQEYLDELRIRHPRLYERLDLARLDPTQLARIYEALDCFASPFDTKEHGGRGDAYRSTQLAHPLVRARGISNLCELAIPVDSSPARSLLLDALGGNGTMTRAMRLLQPDTSPAIFTGDVAAPMIADALAQGLPAVRQSTQRWLFRDAALDGVIFAYGTHHIPVDERPQAMAEAHRVIRPGGRIVVHDFEEGSTTARWYSEALDRYTYTGHKHEHFLREEMHELLVTAGFHDVRVRYLYDPCVVDADSPAAARRGVINYMYDLFALAKLVAPDALDDEDSWMIVDEVVRRYATFGPDERARLGAQVAELTVRPAGRGFRAELPRVALVATATR